MKIERIVRVLYLPGPPADEVTLLVILCKFE